MRLLKKLITVGLMVSILLSLAGCGKDENVIKIGHKNYTEARILGNMFSIMIENQTSYETTLTELGGTSVCFEALKSEDIHLYPEYTGTGYSVVLKQNTLKDPEEVYNYCQEQYNEQYNITWLKPLGFNNTYTMTVRRDMAEELNLKTISDLVKHAPNLVIGAEMEFLERSDGLPGLKEVYGIDSFKEEKGMDIGLTYAALKEGKIDVNDAYGTDGRIKKLDLVSLEDDKQFFPPYYSAPLVNEAFMANYPEAVDALNMLDNQFTDEEMQALNLLVDEGADPKQVAEDILREKGLIQ
ncbi:ABC transporter substrate-binding protein [Vallitalea okinawensis]|uniref:ABC transporter substrate-binding protein n=1 Tax=Vallitalea okinawensis TaxID=2078660 RepID=UPI000CFBE511|nr:glycine betaine ABC transporter substrate-binding protein [Vallitalea okinawensis]